MIGLNSKRTIALGSLMALGVLTTAANAVIVITISDDGTDLTMKATGTYDLSLAINLGFAGSMGANAAVSPALGYYGWETGFADIYRVTFYGFITGSSNAYPASFITSNVPFYLHVYGPSIQFEYGTPTIGTVNEEAVFSGVTLASLGMVPGQTMTAAWPGDHVTITTSINPPNVPAACCIGMICLMSLESDCNANGGSFQGENSDCKIVSCITACAEDFNVDGNVDVTDLLQLIGAWGTCPTTCTEDINGDGNVDVTDLLQLIGVWGTCLP